MNRELAHPARFAIAVVILTGTMIAAALVMFGPLQGADLRLVDDHELLKFLGAGHAIPVSDIPRILFTETEVGRWGSDSRLRPVFYLLRITETSLWHDNAGPAYLSRMLVVALIGASAAYVTLRSLLSRTPSRSNLIASTVAAAAVGLAAMGVNSWTDIATRLGPSETFVALGLIPFGIGAFEILRRPARPIWWALTLIGFLVIVGSKENGLLFLLPLLLLCAVARTPRSRRWMPATAAVVGVIGAAYIALGLVLATLGSGTDMYGDDRSIDEFLNATPNNAILLALLAILVIAVIADARRPVTQNPDDARWAAGRWADRHALALTAGTATLIALGDLYFYQSYAVGGGFVPQRYGFLSEMMLIVGLGVVVTVVARMLPRLRLAGRLGMVGVTLVGVILSPLGDGITNAGEARERARITAETSRIVFDRIQQASADLVDHPGAQALVIADRSFDYELVYSLPQFLAYYGNVDGAFLQVDIPAEDSAASDLQTSLARELVTMSAQGKTDANWRIQPSDDLDEDGYVVCLTFRTVDTPGYCDATYQVN